MSGRTFYGWTPLQSLMTWTEAFRKGRDRWVMWIALGSFLGCCFLVKGGSRSDFLWAALIGAANGAGVGFAVGPAAEKGALILSGLLAGTPFYFIGISAFVMGDATAVATVFVVVGIVISFAQCLRVRRHADRRNASA
jgi:hypothetical protein